MRVQKGFNPTLVRLRPVKVMERKPRPESFNPTLVRLRRTARRLWWRGFLVSIPRWFD